MASGGILNKCLKWGAYSRSKSIREWAWKRVGPEGDAFSTSESAVRILAGGDVTFDRNIRTPIGGVYRSAIRESLIALTLKRKALSFATRRFLSPKYVSPKVHTHFTELSLTKPTDKKLRLFGAQHPLIPIEMDPSESSNFAYTFENVAPLLREMDMVLVNLETPLSGHERVQGHFTCDPGYARAMKEAGITFVNLANNHIFDCGDVGFSDTLKNLDEAGIKYIGGGRDFQDARAGRSEEVNGLRVAALGYTSFCNKKFASMAGEYPGVLPLDPRLIVEDIKAAKEKADLVIVSLHWGLEDQHGIHHRQVEIAHTLIDEGADAIIGHHPHIPHGIEIYRGKPILYSLGNFIFGFGTNHWADNFLAEIAVEEGEIRGVALYPVSGRPRELLQPEVLGGERADSLLRELQIKSLRFDTPIAVKDHIGYIEIAHPSGNK